MSCVRVWLSSPGAEPVRLVTESGLVTLPVDEIVLLLDEGGGGGDGDNLVNEFVHDAAKNIKDLEDKLKQHERDLEDTSSELKIKDELCQKAKEELEEEQRICGEKIEEANTNYAQRKKETQRDMEEQLQILRQESSQALALKGMVSALVNELVEMGLINVTNVVTDVKDNMTDMKSGMKQTAQKIKETQRQMSDKMNETTEELSKKMEEQGTAFRDEVQSTTSRLKDELAAKTDEQVEGMTEKIKTDVKEAIIANIVASSAPVQETTYTAFEEDQNPHDQETSHHILSSSSSNCGNDTYSMQETHDILREDPTIASKVFSGNIDIKERANVDLTRLADKLKANKIISQGDRDKAVDGYTKQTEAQRRGELIDRVHENLREGIGGAFEIFLDILREEDTLQLNKLVTDLERSYDEIGGSGGGAKVGSEAKPQYILTISDLEEVVSALQKYHFATTHWDRLCLGLGILYDKLKDIEDNHPRKVEQQFQEGISLWLRLQYDYEKYGKPTWRKLVNTLEYINERAVAEGIRKDKLK